MHDLANILPPERSTIRSSLGDPIMIVRIPNQRNPRELLFIKEVIHMFDQKSNVLRAKVENTKTSPVFWPAYKVPRSKGWGRLTPIPPPKALSLDSLQLLKDSSWDSQTAQEENWHR